MCAAVVAYFSTLKFRFSESDFLFSAYRGDVLADACGRICIFLVAATCIVSVLLLTTKKRVPLITTIGQNSLAVYLLHRPITQLMNRYLGGLSTFALVACAIFATCVMLSVLGSSVVAKAVDGVLNYCVAIFRGDEERDAKKVDYRKGLIYLILLGIFALPCAKEIAKRYLRKSTRADAARTFPIYRVGSPEQIEQNGRAFKLLFCGDLLLLEDPVKLGSRGEGGFDYADVFEYTRGEISSADLAVGVFEGPCAGAEVGYSSSNYGDGKTLWVNFPDEWARAVKDAGFDLVTLANNHLLDRGETGAKRSLDVLNDVGLEQIGGYSDARDKEERRVKIVEKDGIKFAFLAYTYASKTFKKDGVLGGERSYLTSLIVGPESDEYRQIESEIRADFERAKSFRPDFIVVLPHWGTQFADYPNRFQLHWEKKFKEFGADIILGDHTHSVQPVKISEYQGKTTFTAYCPGNFVNIYREHNGDLSSLIEVNIDRESKTIIGGAIVPMWITASLCGNYRPVPIYSILTDKTIGASFTVDDKKRVEEALVHITRVMLGVPVDANLLTPRYYFDEKGFYRTKTPPLEIDDELRQSAFYKALNDANGVCFIGDSVTEGWRNGGVPWYEPLEDAIRGRVINCGWGSATVKILLDRHIEEICNADADLFVVAIGTNDVRYRNPNKCAMDSDVYVERLGELRSKIVERNPNARFVFIAPWYSTDGDRQTKLQYREKLALYDEYATALRATCDANGDLFLDPNPYIRSRLDERPHSEFMLDYVHPNATSGVRLYSEAALRAGLR